MDAPAPPQEGYQLRVVSREEYGEWRPKIRDYFFPQVVAKIAETGATLILIEGDMFLWICPGCGGTNVGKFGEEPVSGWVNPRWVRSGDDEHLTLEPSLGCPLWRSGQCHGHWWAKEGRLVPA